MCTPIIFNPCWFTALKGYQVFSSVVLLVWRLYKLRPTQETSTHWQAITPAPARRRLGFKTLYRQTTALAKGNLKHYLGHALHHQCLAVSLLFCICVPLKWFNLSYSTFDQDSHRGTLGRDLKIPCFRVQIGLNSPKQAPQSNPTAQHTCKVSNLCTGYTLWLFFVDSFATDIRHIFKAVSNDSSRTAVFGAPGKLLF